MRTIKPPRNAVYNSRSYYIYRKSKPNPRAVSEELQLDIPGWKQLKDKNRSLWRKIIWVTVVSSCFLICAYQVTDRVILFARKPISSTSTIQKNNSVKFPSITVCPRLEVVQSLRTFKEQISKDYCSVTWDHIMTKFNMTINELMAYLTTEYLLESITLRQPSWTKILYNLTISDLDSILGTCKRITIPDLIPFKNANNILELRSSRNYEKCQYQNTPPLFVAVRADDVHLEFNYFPALDVEDGNLLSYTITARQFKFLNTVENPCADIATVQTCQSYCLEKYLMKKLRCKLRSHSRYNLPNCTTVVDFITATMHVFFAPNSINYRIDCNCPRPCEETSYKVTFKRKNPNQATGIDIYFEHNAISVVTEYYGYSIIQLLCDVGGNLGLFLGLCIPSTLEIVVKTLIYLRRKF